MGLDYRSGAGSYFFQVLSSSIHATDERDEPSKIDR